MENIKSVLAADERRAELHDKLSLTGCEVSVNNLPAHKAAPLAHYTTGTRMAASSSPAVVRPI